VNFNSPAQVVIAGHKVAVVKAIENCEAAGARRAIMLPMSVPSHSSLLTQAGEALQEALAAAEISDPKIKVIAATDGATYRDADDIQSRLSRQVYSPVQWVVTVNALIDGGASRIIECGPGKVLAGLCRRINKSTPTAFIDTTDSLKKALLG
jgi:[acyl-carrier-protein] S-malonyltransferase